MRQFLMNGKAITSPMRFREFFDPRDLLRNRELAAGFVIQQFRMLDPRSLYHSLIFYVAACRMDCILPGNFPFHTAEMYRMNDGLLNGYSLETQEFAKKDVSSAASRQLRESLWQLLQETKLELADQIRLFHLLTAAYSLARKTLESCPLTPEEAEDAYLRREPVKKVQSAWLTFDDREEDISLRASEEPYKILMVGSARELLAQGHPITPRKFRALRHAQGDANVPLTLELYNSPDEPPYRRIKIAVGDYRYFNFVKNLPVHYHPREVRVSADGTVAAALKRDGKKLIYSRSNAAPQTMVIPDSLALYGFALEKNASGFILLTSDGVKYNNYSGRNEFFYLPKKDIVEVAFRGSECLLLDKNGHVHALGGTYSYPHRVVSLDDILHSQK